MGGESDDGEPLLDVLVNISPKVEYKNNLGTIGGVYIPCILSIIGILLFDRIGFILGNSGLIATIGILCIAFLLVILTILSVSAISTNGKMYGRGAYCIYLNSCQYVLI